jgi:hypothetical protein
VKMMDGTEVGMKSRVFDYTGRRLIGLVEVAKKDTTGDRKGAKSPINR